MLFPYFKNQRKMCQPSNFYLKDQIRKPRQIWGRQTLDGKELGEFWGAAGEWQNVKVNLKENKIKTGERFWGAASEWQKVKVNMKKNQTKTEERFWGAKCEWQKANMKKNQIKTRERFWGADSEWQKVNMKKNQIKIGKDFEVQTLSGRKWT